MLAMIDRWRIIVFPPVVGMEIATEHRKPQLLTFFEQDTGCPDFDFHRNDFAGFEL
ncbi:hypothetical protein D3C85_1921410 [compost metagenome]